MSDRDVLDELRETATDTEDTAPNLSKLLSRAVAEIERLREATRWIPVSEKMPEGHEAVVVVRALPGTYYYPPTTAWWNHEQALWISVATGARYVGTITHWKPILPPK